LKERGNRTTTYLLLPGMVFTILFVVAPVVGMVIFSVLKLEFYRFQPVFTLENYIDILSYGEWMTTLETLGRTLYMTGIVLGLVIAGAYPIGYLLARKIKSPVVQTVILLLCILPFWTSYVIRMITWVPLLAKEGIVNQILLSLGLIDAPVEWLLFSPASVVIVEFFLWIVFMVGPIFWVIARISDEVMEASLNLGATRIKRFLTITLPMSVPGIATGIMFVFVMLMSDFATPTIIGGGNYFSLASYLKISMRNSEFGMIASYSVLMIAVTFFIVYLLFRKVDLRKEL